MVSMNHFKLGIRYKVLGVMGTLTLLILGLGVIFVLSFNTIQSGFLAVSKKSFTSYQALDKLSSALRESKNWAVRYTIEQDPKKLDTWKTNYEKSYQKASDALKAIENLTFSPTENILKTVKESFTFYGKATQALFDRHEERLALFEHKRGLQEEYRATYQEILSHLETLLHLESKNRADIDFLKSFLQYTESLYLKPMVSDLEILSEKEIKDKLQQRKEMFQKNIKDFDEKASYLLSKTTGSFKKTLHEAKVKSLTYRNLVFGQSGLSEVYEKDTQELLFVWKSVESLNEKYISVNTQTEALATLVSAHLESSIQKLQSSKARSLSIISLVFGLSLLLLVISLFYASRHLISPIEMLTTHAKKIGEGEFEIKVPVPKTNDEISELAQAFNFMSDYLFRHREQLKIATQEIIKLYQQKSAEPRKQEKPEDFDFPTHMSHEFRTALAVIEQGLTNLDIPTLQEKDQKKIMSACHRAVFRLSDVIETFFDFPKKETIDKKKVA